LTRTLPPRRIAVLFHRNDRRLNIDRYAITHIAAFWRADGHQVEFLFGPRRQADADIVVVHVNLSIVPDPYLEFAARFPVAINGRVRDVRKRSVSRNLVVLGDGWEGPVIAKSDLNYGGLPELMLGGWWPRRGTPGARVVRSIRRRLHQRHSHFVGTDDYRVFEHVSEVPESWRDASNLVLERFLPERDGELYAVRNCLFLGAAHTCERRLAASPVVNSGTAVSSEQIEPDPRMVALRSELGFDYGKFDYVMIDGEPVLLDANKTVGVSADVDDATSRKTRRKRARGLYAFFE
jgi:hypothetical protein